MRRAALRVACVVAGTGVAVAMAASGSAGPTAGTPTSMTLTTSDDNGATLRPDPHGMWGYWGQFTSINPAAEGSYRATCTALGAVAASFVRRPAYTGQVRAAAAGDDRLTCDIVLLFGGDASPTGGSLVVQGVIDRPAGTALFAEDSDRVLAVTGGTGLPYEAKQGKAKPEDGQLVLSYK
jgi:hypothetical protein